MAASGRPDQRLRVFVSSTLQELAAERAAPRAAIEQEVTGRAAIRDLVRELAATAPVTVRRDTSQFAASIGATA